MCHLQRFQCRGAEKPRRSETPLPVVFAKRDPISAVAEAQRGTSERSVINLLRSISFSDDLAAQRHIPVKIVTAYGK